jgi:hypothetical protein
MENLSNDQYNRKIDNEIKKKELENKYGAHFGQSNISPELESEWLKNIEQFEQQFNENGQIKVWEFLGRPAYTTVGDLETEKISEELQKLFVCMNEHNIVLDTLCKVEEKELYRFITEELFVHEIDDIRIEGLRTCFTYEEFHPNAEYDICQAYDYFFRMTMAKMENVGGKGYDLLYIDTGYYIDSNGKNIDKEKVVKTINSYLDSFDYFEFISKEIKSISINKDETDANLTFEIEYKGCFNNSPEFMINKGTGYLRLKSGKYGGWDIYHISLPGLVI